MTFRSTAFRTSLILSLLAGLLSLQACGFAGGASILSSGMGNVTATGVERSLDGAAIKTFSRAQADIVRATERALDDMGFDTGDRLRSDRHVRITARSNRRKVVITVEPVARQASQVRIEVNSGWVLSEDTATATEIMDQISTALRRPADG